MLGVFRITAFFQFVAVGDWVAKLWMTQLDETC